MSCVRRHFRTLAVTAVCAWVLTAGLASGFADSVSGVFGLGGAHERSAWAAETGDLSLAISVSGEIRECLADTEGDLFPAEKLARLRADASADELTVLSPDDYSKQFPDSGGQLGHCHMRSEKIYVVSAPRSAFVRVVIHETLHMASYKSEMRDESGLYLQKGLHGISYALDESGTYTKTSETGRAINEGVTELYTLRELEEHTGLKASLLPSSYRNASENAALLESIVGKDALAEAYFGNGYARLTEIFEGKCGKGTWETYAAAIDAMDENPGRESEDATKQILKKIYDSQ